MIPSVKEIQPSYQQSLRASNLHVHRLGSFRFRNRLRARVPKSGTLQRLRRFEARPTRTSVTGECTVEKAGRISMAENLRRELAERGDETIEVLQRSSRE
jgi:hypothetical protein